MNERSEIEAKIEQLKADHEAGRAGPAWQRAALEMIELLQAGLKQAENEIERLAKQIYDDTGTIV